MIPPGPSILYDRRLACSVPFGWLKDARPHISTGKSCLLVASVPVICHAMAVKGPKHLDMARGRLNRVVSAVQSDSSPHTE
jgi:hypothetical protein